MTTKTKKEEVRVIAPGKVHISALNTRRPAVKDVRASGLLDSIREQGQLTPGLGRPHPAKKGEIELAAGACRLTACAELGVDFRVIVREMTDEELLDAILTENLQRTDPDPEAEARLIERRLSEGMDPGGIAARYGKSEMWVRRRLKLLAVVPELRKRFAPGGVLAHFSTGMRERLGVMDPAEQRNLARHPQMIDHCVSLEGLARFLSRGRIELKGMDFLDDPDTAVKGCGPGCATNAQSDLFPDEGGGCGSCSNRECFELRKGLAVTKAITAVLGGTPEKDVVFFRTDWCGDVMFRGKVLDPVDPWGFREGWRVSKKRTELTGIDVTNPLKPRRVFLETNGKAPARKSGKAKVGREEKLTAKRLALLNERVRKAVETAGVPKAVEMIRLAAVFGSDGKRPFCSSARDLDVWKDAAGKGKVRSLSVFGGKGETVEAVVWESIRKVLVQRLAFLRNLDLLAGYKREEMSRLSWLVGFDEEGEWKKICTVDVPVPKSWGAGIDPMTLKAASGSPGRKAGKKVAAKVAGKAAKKTAGKRVKAA